MIKFLSLLIVVLGVFVFALWASDVTRGNEIRNLQPPEFWNRFYDISQIPRCSRKEKRIKEEYLTKIATSYGWKSALDSYGNFVVHVPATPGKEDKTKIVIQSHLDMVCEKNSGSPHNFDTDPLELLFLDDKKDWVVANKTTLGADDGFGIAFALALATDKTVHHGPLDLLFTVEEEIGLMGALNLDSNNFVSGSVLLNIDSGQADQITIACAGGIRLESTIAIEWTGRNPDWNDIEIKISGLLGGHSGKDIHLGRGNSLKLAARVLQRLDDLEMMFHLLSIEGGSAHNAIPREAFVKISIPKTDADLTEVKKILKDLETELLLEYGKTDGGLSLTVKSIETTQRMVYSDISKKKILNVLLAAPHGVMAMMPDRPVVETSLNLAAATQIEEIDSSRLLLIFTVRSSIDSAKYNVVKSVKALIALAGGQTKELSDYPGWMPNPNSQALKIASRSYHNLFGKDPSLTISPAGLEPGIIGGKYPSLKDNMLSVGTTIRENHSPFERMHVADVARTYLWLKEILNDYAK